MQNTHEHDENTEFVTDADAVPAETFDDESVDADAAQNKVATLKKQLAACKRERQEYLDGWQRAQADHLNYKQRIASERAQDRDRIEASLIENMLPLCDSFDSALHAGTDANASDAAVREGMVQIHAQLKAFLQSLEVTVIDPHGAEFDPHEHEAVSEQQVANGNDAGRVISVLQKGYRIRTTLIRPAKVVVGVEGE